MPVEGGQSLAVDHTGDWSIGMESPHWEEGGMFIWYKEELGLGMVLVWVECCHGALGGQVLVLLSCGGGRKMTSQHAIKNSRNG